MIDAPRAHPAQVAGRALRPLRVAGAAAVAEQVDVELELLPARGDREHVVVELLERRARAEQREPGADAADVRVDRHVGHPVGEQEHAGGGLAADAGERDELGARVGDVQVREVVERGRIVELAQDRLDPGRLDAADPARADRRLDVGVRGVADLGPAAEPRAEAQERDVAVAVVRRLAEHREDQLVERLPVRRRARAAVDEPQPVAQRAHPAAGRRGPVGAPDGLHRGEG